MNNPIKAHMRRGGLDRGTEALCGMRPGRAPLTLVDDWRTVSCKRCLVQAPSATATVCPHCQGYGQPSPLSPDPCEDCGGTGRLP